MEFPMTREGYLLACEYLTKMELWTDRLRAEDGYTIIYYANYMVEKNGS